MTDDERYIIEGRTRAALKESKRHIGLLRADISQHAEMLKEASAALAKFVADPVGAGPTGMSKADYLLHFYKSCVPAEIEAKIRELSDEVERERKLEKQVAEF